MPRLGVNGEELFYIERQGREPGLAFVHGAGGSHRAWGEVLAGLKGPRLIALDLPGHGRSLGKGCDSIRGYSDLVAKFTVDLGLRSPFLVGHSMGGAIVLDLALHHPGALVGLVLVGSGARLRVLPSILEGTGKEFETTARLVCEQAYGPSAKEELVALGLEEMLATGPQVLLGDFLACDRFDVMSQLNLINKPTLIICGEKDQMTPIKYSQFLQENIQDSELVVIPDAGHMVMLEKPEEVSRAISAFVEGIGVG